MGGAYSATTRTVTEVPAIGHSRSLHNRGVKRRAVAHSRWTIIAGTQASDGYIGGCHPIIRWSTNNEALFAVS